MIAKRGTIAAVGGFLFVLDQVLKYIARITPEATWYLWKPWLGWEFFANTGIAFSLPFPRLLILLVTPVLLIALLVFSRKRPATLLIVAGALSNYIDRVFFGHTIDYIRIATGIFNIADFMIVIGLIVLFFRR